MHRARQHAETRTREWRHRLAHEAARLMAESGIRDYHQAKLKAAQSSCCPGGKCGPGGCCPAK